jgi:Flp pilus assembly pilin Flp
MRKRLRKGLRAFLRKQSGQGITEYAAMIAFVAILVAIVFTITQGGLAKSVSAAYSSIIVQLNNLSTASGTAQG